VSNPVFFTNGPVPVQEMIRTVNEDIQFNKRDVQMLRHEKQQLENVLSTKSIEVRKNLQIEAQR
jgi:hypothetical protein